MKLITKITFDGYDECKEVVDIGNFDKLEDLNRAVIKQMCHNLDRDLVWEEGRREFVEWLECSKIDPRYFDLDRDAIDIDSRSIPMDTFVAFQHIWNETWGDNIQWEFSICF